MFKVQGANDQVDFGGGAASRQERRLAMKTQSLTAILCSALLIQLASLPDFLYAQADFYKGKTIRIVHGRNAGGSGDLRVRALVPFLQKYIPGSPTIVHEFMPGGGGRKTGNFIFESAKPDGLTLGNTGAGMVSSAVLGEKGVNYDLDKLIFLGSPYSSTHYLFLTRREAGLTNLEKLRSASGVRIGAQSVGHTIYNIGRVFAWLTPLKDANFVTGYSTPERDAALMSGEIDAIGTADDHITRNIDWVKNSRIDLHLMLEVPKGLKHPQYGYLPDLENFAKSEKERRVLSLFRNLRLTGSPFFAPPGTPAERIEILKQAITKTFKDPEFPKEYKKLVGDDPSPLFPDENQKAIRELPRDAETIALYNKLAGPGPLPPR
jgi:tripartite-type tricarboxylate transporter receptor subunit TctC